MFLWLNPLWSLSVKKKKKETFPRYIMFTLLRRQKLQHMLQHWWVFIRLLKGYYHNDQSLISFRRLLHPSRCCVQYNAGAAWAWRFSVKQEMTHPLYYLLIYDQVFQVFFFLMGVFPPKPRTHLPSLSYVATCPVHCTSLDSTAYTNMSQSTN